MKKEVSTLQYIINQTQMKYFIVVILFFIGNSFGSGLAMIGAYTLAALIACLSFKRKNIDLNRIMPFNTGVTLKSLLLVIPIFITSTYVAGVIYWCSSFLAPDLISSAMEEASMSVDMFIYVALLGPFFEEFAIRGLVFGGIRRTNRIWYAIIISAIIFGLMHGNLVQLFYTAVVGLCLAYEREKTGTMWIPVIQHVVNNIWSVIEPGLWKKYPSLAKYLTPGGFSTEGSALVVLILISLVSAIALPLLLKQLTSTEKAEEYKKIVNAENEQLLAEQNGKVKTISGWLIAAIVIDSITIIFITIAMVTGMNMSI